MAKGKIDKATARRIAELHKYLVDETEFFNGCHRCGSRDHVTADHGRKR